MSDQAVDDLLASFEDAWAVQVDEMAHPAPIGTETWYFNVYIGDSGDGTPGGYGAGGYYYVDTEGQPMIVVANGTLASGSDWADATATHEFYHAIQGSLNRFEYSGLGAWFWEATAEWAALETHPTNPAMGALFFGYVLLPDLPVNFFDYPDTFALEEYHQYGAFLLPHYLTTQVVGFELVRDAWVVPGEEMDPLEVIRSGLAASGHDFDDVWLDHIAANVVFDYAQGEQWAAQIGYIEDYFGGRRIAYSTSGDGIHDQVRIEGSDRAPHRYGYNVIELKSPIPGDVELSVVGDAFGSEGNPASFGAEVVLVEDGVPTYTRVPFDGTSGQLELPVGDAEVIYLVVGAWTPGTEHWEEETFPYAYTLSIGDQPPEASGGVMIGNVMAVEEVAQVCASSRPTVFFLGIPLVLAVRRRRAPAT